MMRMPGPGGAVVVVGGRMTRMLGLGSSGGSGGMRGVGRLLLFRLGWGRVRPFVVSFAWACGRAYEATHKRHYQFSHFHGAR